MSEQEKVRKALADKRQVIAEVQASIVVGWDRLMALKPKVPRVAWLDVYDPDVDGIVRELRAIDGRIWELVDSIEEDVRIDEQERGAYADRIVDEMFVLAPDAHLDMEMESRLMGESPTGGENVDG